MGGRVEETLGQGLELLVGHLLGKMVDSHGADKLAIANSGAIGERDNLVLGVNLGHLTLLAKTLLLLGQGIGYGNPDTAGTVTGREFEGGVGAPVAGNLVQDDVLGDGLDIGSGDTLTEPLALHLGGGNGPDLVVVRTHEHVGNTLARHSHDPLIKVLGLGVGDAALESSIDETIYGLDLVLLGQDRDVVLEGVGHPNALVSDIGDTLVSVPVLFSGQSLLNDVVEVLVVGEDDVTANIVQLSQGAQSANLTNCKALSSVRHCKRRGGSLKSQSACVRSKSTYETLIGDIGTGQTTSLVRRVDNQP